MPCDTCLNANIHQDLEVATPVAIGSLLLPQITSAQHDLDTLHHLLWHGANPNVICAKSGSTPLVKAMILNRPDIAQALLNAKAQTDFADEHNITPWQWAVHLGTTALLEPHHTYVREYEMLDEAYIVALRQALYTHWTQGTVT